MDCHGAFALELVRDASASSNELVEGLKMGDASGLSSKMRALIDIGRIVQRRSPDLTRDDVARALRAGATDADTQLTVLIAAAFCMYNRMVDGLRARTPRSLDVYRARATEIAEHGYCDPRVASVPK
jgi:alkylhydroperoxidase/carboxymuconolactone decarboxylase family protein YurZ